MDIGSVIKYLKNYNGKKIKLMEICGTHTASIMQNAIPSLINKNIELISGPGCPVCVTVSDYTDKLIELALNGNVIVTFGDMIRVPGSKNALKDIKSSNTDIRMVYSPMQITEYAKQEPNKEFIFAAVGFETTTPVYALLIEELIKQNIKNVKLLTALKTMPGAVDKICSLGGSIDGFIAPGHVCAVTGSNVFIPLAQKYNIPFVVSGFEAKEILSSIYALTKMQGKDEVLNLYKYVVKEERNQTAYDKVHKYFEECDASWRGLGIIKNSGLALKNEYAEFDAGSKELINDFSCKNGCICAKIIIGEKKPDDCPLYSKVCTPEHPCGACMVSGEGTCFNYYSTNEQ